MNIYEKINAVRMALLKAGITKDKQGFNYAYIDLPQIEGIITEECNKVKLMTLINFPDGHATMTAIDLENPIPNPMRLDMAQDPCSITISVPCESSMVDIKGSQQIQKVGGMMTYMRRYLYMQMFAISEHDSVEGIGRISQETANDVETIDNKEVDKEREEIIEKYKTNLPNYLEQLVAYKKVKSVDDIPTEYLIQVYENKMKKEQKNEQ